MERRGTTPGSISAICEHGISSYNNCESSKSTGDECSSSNNTNEGGEAQDGSKKRLTKKIRKTNYY